MSNFHLFICGLVITMIAGMGVITSEVFLGYAKFKRSRKPLSEVKTKTV